MDFLNTRISLHRPITSYSKVRMAIGNVVRGRSFQTRKLPAAEYLNAGCGPNHLQGFINLDYLWTPEVDMCWDVTTRLPFKDSSFAGVYTEHCLEHLPRESSAAVLREFRRVVRPGGTLRVVVPDAELYMTLYVKAKQGEVVRFPYAGVACSPIEHVNRIFRDHGHLYAYDAEYMCAVLQSAGFENASRSAFMKSRDPQLRVDTQSRECESLYVEGW